MIEANSIKFFQSDEYTKFNTRANENTEISDNKRKPDKKTFTKSSTEADTGNKTENREETEQKESPNLNQRIPMELEVIPDSNPNQNNGDALHNENQISNLSENRTQNKKVNSTDSKTLEATKTKEKEKIFEIKKTNRNNDTSNPPAEKHGRDTKDNLTIKVCRMAVNSIHKMINNRCERRGLKLKKVKVVKVFGNIRKQKWFVKRKIKYIFASNHANKKVIKKMMKIDKTFKNLVELTFEDFYKKYFIINNKYFPIDKKSSLFLAHFKTFKDCLVKELAKKADELKQNKLEAYKKRLINIGNILIDEINGGGFYDPRCNRKRIKTKVCFIKYKPN
jgi:hypothetical protein